MGNKKEKENLNGKRRNFRKRERKGNVIKSLKAKKESIHKFF